MFTSILRRPRRANHRVGDRDLSFSPPSREHDDGRPQRLVAKHASADFTEADDDDDSNEDEDEVDAMNRLTSQGNTTRVADEEDEDEENEEDEDEEEEDDEEVMRMGNIRRGPPPLPVLPLFSSTHLDSLPVYSATHAIRIIICTRTETSLTWDQLRSPQVSQFLVKPMQQQIRTTHFSRSTLYALMANCLQFTKEGQRYAANAGTSNTRAKVCELLALKLLKEYTTRELIDALAYDFYPLQGLPGITTTGVDGRSQKQQQQQKQQMGTSRTSTLEVAIRASAKHFLAHPVVVQQLEAIWSGAITFYSSADRLHRDGPLSPTIPSHHTNTSSSKPNARTPLLGSLPLKDHLTNIPQGRRTVMLYDPRQASIFKLSRLRVPRYRSFLSTVSLAVLIGLFLAVLAERSIKITALELVFWFWSAGFMLDELVGFNEQGFALYIMSFWNIFDLGILMLLIVYYCMRAYGVFLADPHHWNGMAYDVLAANAVLLLPRIFSVLDHYQYFSQLLIAFRLMAVDLAAVFMLVGILCSGFFVFFTLSHNDNDAADVAYKIFQLLMGFSPAAWDVWPTYNWLGRTLLVLFLIICHFLVVTILITVLTNSFMAIASNATEEHQFLFAINTISMVKDNAMFSYIAPSNIFAWLLMPLRYCLPLRQFVWLNRTIIKVTHLPVLLCIYLYERFWLAPSVYEPTDLVEHPHRNRLRSISFADPAARTAGMSPNIRTREESVAGFHKDRALEEVFLRVPNEATLRTQKRMERHKQQTAIRNWMDQHDEPTESPVQWPTVDSRPAIPEWQRRLSTGFMPSNLRQVSDMRSVASDPADLLSNMGAPVRTRPSRMMHRPSATTPETKDHTDADGDDELVTNDEEEEEVATNMGQSFAGKKALLSTLEEDYFTTPIAARATKLPSSYGSIPKPAPPTPRPNLALKRVGHNRTQSSSTILFNPEELRRKSSSSSSTSPPVLIKGSPLLKQRGSGRNTGSHTPVYITTAAVAAASGSRPVTPGAIAIASGRTSPRRPAYHPTARPRPIFPPRGHTDIGAITRSALLAVDNGTRGGLVAGGGGIGGSGLNPVNPRLKQSRRLSSLDLGMLSDNIASEDPNTGMAGSFQTQMAAAMMHDNRLRAAKAMDHADGDRDRMGRLVLARMKTLEESFAEVIKEMRDLKNNSTNANTNANNSTASVTRRNSLTDSSIGPPTAGVGAVAAGAGGAATIEVAGRMRAKRRKGDVTPKRVTAARPGSERSAKEGKSVGTPAGAAGGGGGSASPRKREKAPAMYESEEEDDDANESFIPRGSSL